LPSSQEIELTIVDQWGGAPQSMALEGTTAYIGFGPQSMALEGTTAYIGFGPRLFVVDVSDPSEPRLLGRSDILPNMASGIDVVNGLAYLAAGWAGLVVLDVSDPAAMLVVSEGPNYPSDQPAYAQSVTVDGDTAFVVDHNRFDGQTTLLLFDVSDPAEVSFLESHALPTSVSVQLTEELIVVTSASQLQLRDAANPASIMSETPLVAGNYNSQAVVQDDIIIVAECCDQSGSKIERLDVSDPYHPAAAGPPQTLSGFNPADHAAAEGGLLVTASTFGEFGFCGSTVNLIDIAGESAQVLATFDPENCLKELILDGDRLYLTGGSGLQIYDLGNPANPDLLGQFRHPDGFHTVEGLARRNGLTYVLNSEGRGSDLTTLDLSEQPPDLVIGQQRVGQEALLDPFISGDALIIPVWQGSLYTLDISEPAAPQLLHRPVEGEPTSADFFNVAIGQGVLYIPVVDDALIGGIGVFDLGDPANPVLAGTVETGDSMILSLALSGDTLYVLSQDEESHVTLYDVSQPLAPEHLATLTMPEFVNRLAVVGDSLYAACDSFNCQSVYFVDVADKQEPDVVSRWTIPFGVRDMVPGEQGVIYLVTSEQRIVIMDGSDPSRLRLTGDQRLPGAFNRLLIEGDHIYAAAFDGGLYQLQSVR
jgi:hypothetical protein